MDYWPTSEGDPVPVLPANWLVDAGSGISIAVGAGINGRASPTLRRFYRGDHDRNELRSGEWART
jgi:hypothetical protein